MGDEGRLYDTIDRDITDGMKKLVNRANLITPNITEAAILLGDKNYERLTDADLKKILKKLSDLGPSMVVVTSVQLENEDFPVVAAYDSKSRRFWKIKSDYIPVYYPGTGDIFASIMTGCILRGDSLPVSAATAVEFISAAIKETYGHDVPPRNGIMFEKVLNLLAGTRLSGFLNIAAL
jgi:pyridoxine kinase